MNKLWAPWRMEYILQEKPEGCIFCDKPLEARDRENLILHRGASCFVIMNFYPYNNGHLMVVPYRHTADLAGLTESERLEMMTLLGRCTEVLGAQMHPQGFNIGMNLGQVAGAGIDEHLHFHIVPRWNGDTNFMPVTGHTKVLSQGLQESWEALRGLF
ncbi:MAG TPA: HIT domain-containing protein [bacterium]|nr:HIT domain-containing protein [bacterium]HQG44490.1 HIT domain-containing protein [bacterium]HQI48013.1 HIT domain-containing protein [bacterium]HQJ64983.1 HIT domain-containing protein [bacterium]